MFTLSFDTINPSPKYSVHTLAELFEELTELCDCDSEKFWSIEINDSNIADFLVALYLISCEYGLYVLITYLLKNKWIGQAYNIRPIANQCESIVDAYKNLEDYAFKAYPYSLN